MTSIIYVITNKVNSNFYIGKTTKTATIRLKRHFYTAKKGSKTHLHKAMIKYGFENFNIDIIEQTNSPNEREIFWIEQLKPHYNMTTGGDGGDTSSSINYKKSMSFHHLNRDRKTYASYGMLGKSHPRKGKSLEKNWCAVVCEGIEYSSISEAEKAYPGIKIRHRIDSSNYPEFYRLQSKTKRPRKKQKLVLGTGFEPA